MIIEPSAGNGSFSKQISNCKAYDIEPEDASIIKQDFLALEPQCSKNLLVIGNPPFGKRSSLAKEFIKHSIDIGARTIAFILPNTFCKRRNQTVFPLDWKLTKIVPLTESVFEVDGKDYYVPCSFFIWTCNPSTVDLREKDVIDIKEFKDFTFLKKEDPSANFAINGNSGKIKDIKDITNPKAEHYIKGSEEIKQMLSNINWKFHSSANGGISWIGRTEIIKQYLEYKEKIIKKT